MKMFNKIFITPIMLRASKNLSIFGTGKPNISIRWYRNAMLGTGRSVSYTLQILTAAKHLELQFVWRPGVTKYWWTKKKRMKKWKEKQNECKRKASQQS